MRQSLFGAIVLVAAAAWVAGCGRSAPPPAADSGKAADAGKGSSATKAAAVPAKLLLAPEDLLTVRPSDQSQGPVITGSIQPERRADLRAEVSAVVMQVLKDNGEAVRSGDLLARLDDTAIRESLSSAQESLRAARQALEQSQRQVERLKALQAQGMAPMQQLEDAEVRRNNAQSEVAAAESRMVTARQQLRRTEIRAPFDGVVSERKVSVGDTVQPGRELIKVVDLRSMRFEGMVSADRMHELKVGQTVSFRVNGYPNVEFAGSIKRIDAAANPQTRQVEVLVGFSGTEAPKMAGLYAEGRIASATQRVLTVPEAAVQRAGEAAHVWRVGEGAIAKVAIKLGARDERRGEFTVAAGLAEGDRILRNPSRTLVEGQKFELTAGIAPMGVGTATAANGSRPAAAAAK